MARYIKANPKVAKYLHLENDRLQLKDGNYILWQGDMTAFGPLPLLNDTLAQIGGIALMPHEAKQEQDGSVVRPLPTATDERFIVEETSSEGQAPASSSEETTEAEGSSETDATTDEQSEAEGESTEQPTDEPEPEAESEGQAEGENESENETETTDETPNNE